MEIDTLKSSIQIIKDVLNPIAEKIGQGGEYIFSLAVRQVYVNAIVDGLFLFFMLTLLYPAYKWIKFGLKKKEGSNYSWFDDHDGVALITIIAGVTYGVCLIIATFSFISSIFALANPEWRAFEILLKSLTGKSCSS